MCPQQQCLQNKPRLFTNNASQCQGQVRDKQGQGRDMQRHCRDKQRQAGTNRYSSFLLVLVLVCPCLSLSVPVCPCLSLLVLVCPCLSLSVPVSLSICYTCISPPEDKYHSINIITLNQLAKALRLFNLLFIIFF